MKTYLVIWDLEARNSLKEIYLYIQKESPSAAKKVRNEILKITKKLHKMPERFVSERYLTHKGKEYHSFTKWSYKIIYRISEREIRILAIVHTSRNTNLIEGMQ